MKKILSLILTLCLLCSVIALAETSELNQSTSSGETVLTYTVAESVDTTSYVVTIPSGIRFGTDGTASGTITIGANPVLADGKGLQITMTSDYKLEKYGDASVTIPYAYVDGNDTTTTESPLTICTYAASLLTAEKTVPLNFELTMFTTDAGIYSDTITFTVSVVDVQ